MKTTTINTQAELESLLSEYGNLIVEGNLVATISISVQGFIKVGGYIESGDSIESGDYIESGSYIESGGSIESRGYIESRSYIESRGYIESGDYIESRSYIESRGYIKSGGYIEAGYILSLIFEIKCEKMITSKMPFYRNYYSEMPGMEKFAEIIQEKCWDDIREALMGERDYILNLPCWHPIIRTHIENFLK